ncbi:ATP-dependent DNA ligase [Cohnella silvisoli]|uniref:ATP-dependent DNA ligase n=1 Tax=Cohnella silvisoli TaxID=2873699 RepID=A0ABV1L094_9BACL|nr:ATP-dependent DNA ligase [Cohnella silvisoli]MCD9024332.1 ATP-dependent DNA ligase [Cohnella silvisoli]
MFLAPMLLEKREKPFDDARYIFEPKIDGHRMVLSIEYGVVRLYTRHNNEVTRQYPELHNVPIEDNSDVVLDGEVACINPETGSIDFELIQKRFKMRKPMTIQAATNRQPVIFFAFDILRYKGKDLRGLTLMERKAVLFQVLAENKNFSLIINVEGAGKAMFRAIEEKKLEGIVAKKKLSRYVGGKSENWLKIINYTYAEVRIAGYRKDQFGWLLRHRDRNVGILEFAVPSAHRAAFYGVAKGLVTGEDHDFVYVEPRINVRVRFRNWTRAGMLRTPEFVDFVI